MFWLTPEPLKIAASFQPWDTSGQLLIGMTDARLARGAFMSCGATFKQ